jgi:molybdenum cofactor guanylyltransferase
MRSERITLKISCIALAGGKSTRLGRNKLFEVIGDKSLFARVISKLALFNSEIIVVSSEKAEIPQDIKYANIRIVQDVFPGKGSLGGIYTGLAASKTVYNLVVACDMPFLNYKLLGYFIEAVKGFDLAAYNMDNKFEPLHAVYSKNCLPSIAQLLERKNVRIIEILQMVKARIIPQSEIERIDPHNLSFFNINTEEDLLTARQICCEYFNNRHYGLATSGRSK